MKDKRILEDRKRLESFQHEDGNRFEKWLSYLKTAEISIELKLGALKKAFEAKNASVSLELYLQLTDYLPNQKKDKELLHKISQNIAKWKTKRMQMKMLGNRLPPLDFYNQTKFRLDDWQIQVLKFLQRNNNLKYFNQKL